VTAPEQVTIHWKDNQDKPYKQLEYLRTELEKSGQSLAVLMNAGIYEPGETPTGLHIQQYETLNPLNTNSGDGNFYTKPNGVFGITKDQKAFIIETSEFENNDSDIRLATQSGPLLIQKSQLTAIAKKATESEFSRNGVGVKADGRIIFIYSSNEISLNDFANMFLKAGAVDALYLDGAISKATTPEPGKKIQDHTDFAAILAVTEP